MDTEAKRFSFIQVQSGLTKKDFADSLGLSKSHGFQIGAGRLKPSREVMERLSSIYNVNLHWFLTGEGSPGYGGETVSIELIEQEAAAGHGREVFDYADKHNFQVPLALIAPHRPERLKAVFVAGDSMVDAHLCDGDIAIFHPGISTGNGIFVVSIGNALVVKKVDRDIANNCIILISANPAYEPRRFCGPELEDIRIAGRVVACYHRV